MTAQRPATAKDVAALAGVARSAVSMVINGNGAGMVAADKQERIWGAARELGYRPHAVGRSLRSRRTRTIGLVTDEIASGAFAGALIRGATEVAMAAGHLVLTVDVQADPRREPAAYEALLGRQVDALVFAALSLRSYDPPAVMIDHPAVLANCFDPRGRVPGVVADEVSGGHAAAQLLLDAGHRSIVVLGGGLAHVAAGRREEGIAAAVALAGHPALEVVRTGWEINDGVRAATAVLSRAQRPTALLCANDRVATGAVLAAARLGLEVPTDVSLVGYDNDENLAAQMVPALTTVALPHEQIGAAAMRGLIAQLTEGVALPTDDQLVPCVPVLRDSVAPVGARR